MLLGINHVTIAVNDINESFAFYVRVLGMKPHAKWKNGAYLTLNELWFCLSVDPAKPSQDYSHLAFDVSEENFHTMQSSILQQEIKQWKENTSEGHSLYFLDPNGHKLELHVGSLNDRLESLKHAPYEGLTLF